MKSDSIPKPVVLPGITEVGPYYTPLKADGMPAKFLKSKPKTDAARCVNCGICAASCPMGAILTEEVSSVPGTCIKCHSCIHKCPEHAKYFDDPDLLSHIEMLEKISGRTGSHLNFMAYDRYGGDFYETYMDWTFLFQIGRRRVYSDF